MEVLYKGKFKALLSNVGDNDVVKNHLIDINTKKLQA